MQNQHNRGQDGAGIASIKLDMAPGMTYIDRERSNTSSPLKDIFNAAYKPLQDIYDEEKHEADLEACKKAHQTQLLHYAICYMFEYGKTPTRVRVENIVKHETVEIQIFEWEFSRKDLLETQEKIFTVINTIELILDGVDPMLVMRLNHTGYIGSETENFKDEIKKIINATEKN